MTFQQEKEALQEAWKKHCDGASAKIDFVFLKGFEAGLAARQLEIDALVDDRKEIKKWKSYTSSTGTESTDLVWTNPTKGEK